MVALLELAYLQRSGCDCLYVIFEQSSAPNTLVVINAPHIIPPKILFRSFNAHLLHTVNIVRKSFLSSICVILPLSPFLPLSLYYIMYFGHLYLFLVLFFCRFRQDVGQENGTGQKVVLFVIEKVRNFYRPCSRLRGNDKRKRGNYKGGARE